MQERYYVGAGTIDPPNLGLPPNVKKPLFDELKASAFWYKNERSVACKILENVFSAGAPPGPR